MRLRQWTGAVLLEARYGSARPWPAAADGAGHSLVLARPSLGGENPRAWAASEVVGGSPGRNESPQAEALGAVVINEVMPRPMTGGSGFVELYNHSNETVDLSNAMLTDSPSVPKFIIPANTVLAPRTFIAFDQGQLGFPLPAPSGTIYLWNSSRTKVIDAVQFDSVAAGTSWGRHPDGAERIGPLASSTPGARNSARLRSQVIINEIMYHPISGLADDEYVELHNRGTR